MTLPGRAWPRDTTTQAAPGFVYGDLKVEFSKVRTLIQSFITINLGRGPGITLTPRKGGLNRVSPCGVLGIRKLLMYLDRARIWVIFGCAD